MFTTLGLISLKLKTPTLDKSNEEFFHINDKQVKRDTKTQPKGCVKRPNSSELDSYFKATMFCRI